MSVFEVYCTDDILKRLRECAQKLCAQEKNKNSKVKSKTNQKNLQVIESESHLFFSSGLASLATATQGRGRDEGRGRCEAVDAAAVLSDRDLRDLTDEELNELAIAVATEQSRRQTEDPAAPPPAADPVSLEPAGEPPAHAELEAEARILEMKAHVEEAETSGGERVREEQERVALGIRGHPRARRSQLSTSATQSKLIRSRMISVFNDTLAERLRRRPAKPMGSPRVGSNPTGVVCGVCSKGWGDQPNE